MKRTWSKVLSVLLTAVMVLNLGVTTVFGAVTAVSPLQNTSGLPACHPQHDAACGYAQTVTMGGCTHAHNSDCGYTAATAEQPCNAAAVTPPEGTAEGAGEPAAAHTHDAACGYAPATEGTPCTHQHDGTCGYAETLTVTSPCTHQCTQCKPADSGNQTELTEPTCTCGAVAGENGTIHTAGCPLYAAPQCICPPVESGTQVHTEGCPLYTAPAQSEALKAVLALVDALPYADAITEENKEDTLPAFEAAAMAYGALSDEDKAAFDATEQHQKLTALRDVLLNAALLDNETTFDISTGDLVLTERCGNPCQGHTVTGIGVGKTISVLGGTHNVTLNNVSIDVSSVNNASAFDISASGSVNLTLVGNNTLKGASFSPGIRLSIGASLTITGGTTDSLTAMGGDTNRDVFSAGAGIGGKGTSNITINGGNITATGGAGTISGALSGAGIGGGCNVTINGGTVTATGAGGAAGIGGNEGKTADASSAGGTVIINGDAVVYATKGETAPHHIGPGLNGAAGTITKTRGIVFEGTSGNVYGNVTLAQNLTILRAQTLTIGSGAVLTNNSATLLAQGTLTGAGTINGSGTFKASIAQGDIAPIPNQAYTGKAVTPEVTLNNRTIMGKAFTIDITGFTKSYTDNINVGAAAKVIFTNDSNPTVKAEQTFTIVRSAPTFGVTTNNVDNTFAYGDTITFTAALSAPASKARAAAANTVDFYYGTTKLNPAAISLVENSGTGTATFAYDTANKGIPIGKDLTIRAEYGGGSNYNSTSQTIAVTLNPKPLTASVNTSHASASKAYNASADFTNVALTLTGTEGGDTVTATADGMATKDGSADGNAAAAKPFTATSVTLGGAHAGHYSLDKTAVSGNVAITGAIPTVTVTAVKQTKSLLRTIIGSHNDTILLTATMAGINDDKPNGTVVFKRGTTEIGTATTAGGVATFAWANPPAGTITVTAEFTAAVEETNYIHTAVTGTAEAFDISKGERENFAIESLPVTKYGDSPFSLSCEGVSGTGAAVHYTSSNEKVLTISGSTATIIGVGTATITASIESDANFNPATATLPIIVGKATPTVRWKNSTQNAIYTGEAVTIPTPPTVSGAQYGVAPTGTVRYAYKSRSDGFFAGLLSLFEGYTDGLPTEVGIYDIKAQVAADDNYTQADSDTAMTLTVERDIITLDISDAHSYLEITATGYKQGTAAEIPYIGDYKITGKTNFNIDPIVASNHITVSGGTHHITLSNAEIVTRREQCAFWVTGGSTVNLTLNGNNRLESGGSRAGLEVSEGNAVTIDALGFGALSAESISSYDNGGAGIGGASGSAGGNITINGGEIRTACGDGAGIGGGRGGAGGNIIINGGLVYAQSGSDGAGIGGGNGGNGGNITINGGEVRAYGNTNGAAIGGGTNGTGGNITINDGKVNTDNIDYGQFETIIYSAGIGGGIGGDGGNININGGEVTIKDKPGATTYGAGIGGGKGSSGGSITISFGTVIIQDDATITSSGAGIGGGSGGDGGTINISGGRVNAASRNDGASIGGGSGGNGGTINISGGEVKAASRNNGAAIGGGSGGNGGTIHITGGTASAQSVNDGAGIGGGSGGDGGEITISGNGRVSAGITTSETNGKGNGAAIGGGKNGAGGTINISGSGLVMATAGPWAAGIGGGGNASASNTTLDDGPGGAGGTITISGSTVIATGGGNAGAGIGGGRAGEGGSITITRGWVDATGGNSGAGIGGGGIIAGGTTGGGTITISGGTVKATGGNSGAGIGGGGGGEGGNITINGGTVTATSGNYGAGIGGGDGGAGGNITIESNAVVFAESANAQHIGAGMNGKTGTVTKKGGIVFEGNTGLLYGTGVTPSIDFQMSENCILTIFSGQTLTIDDTISLQNNGIIINRGTINGTVTGNQPIVPGAAVTLDISGAEKYVEITPTGYKVGTATEIPHSGDYIITGTATSSNVAADKKSHVLVSGGTHNITLQNVTIQLSDITPFRVSAAGTVNLTLEGTNVLQTTAESSSEDNIGLGVYGRSTLVITKESTGSLTATGGAKGVGIGGFSNTIIIDGGTVVANGGVGISGTVYINGGTVTANGGAGGAGISGTVTISGGDVTANGGVGDKGGAGIGSGYGGAGDTIIINGGKVAATGGVGGAGIGGADGIIAINGGDITANGGMSGAGIGGGERGTITINGGDVTATGGIGGAGIGGGAGGTGGTVTISGGDVTANGGDSAAGIGGGISGAGGSVIIENGTVNATGDVGGAGIGGGAGGAGGTITIKGGTVNATGGYQGAGIGGGYCGVGGIVTVKGGTVNTTGGEQAAGIGGGSNASGDSVTVSGGEVTATGGEQAAGIGGGYSGNVVILGGGGSVIIENGTVTATGDGGGAGIGGGAGGNGGTITIKGGTVTANSDRNAAVVVGDGGAGIGSGHNGAGGTVTISGGTVKATGIGGAGIGSGRDGAGGTVIIENGTVNAISLSGGAGIGGGKTSEGGTVTIENGTVTATGGDFAAGIGGGENRAGGTITIKNGTVTATGGGYAAGIGGGGGNGGAGGNITINGNALVYATKGGKAPNHIGAGAGATGGTITKTRGTVFEGTSGTVYGSVTLEQPLTLAPEQSLTIGNGSTAEIAGGAQLTNNGTLILRGTLSGAGTLSGTGTFKVSIAQGDIAPIANQGYTGKAVTPEVTLNNRTIMGKAFTIDTTGFTKSYANNIKVGTVAKVIFTNDSDPTVKAEQTFAIAKENSALGLTTNKTGNTFAYGDSITFTASVSVSAAKGRSALKNTVDFYCGETKLNTTPISLVESNGTGTASFAYSTGGKGIPLGTQTITAKYGGGDNVNGTEQTVTVTLNKKQLTGGTVAPSQSKPYDGKNTFSGLSATFAAANGVVGSDTVTATVDGTSADAEVGSSLLTATKATFGGEDAGFYLLPASPATIQGNVSITKIDPSITVETSKSGDLSGRELVVTVKITNPAGAAKGFPAAGDITLTATDATVKTPLAGTNGIYTATYTLGAYSAGAKASFTATMPLATRNYNANTTGVSAEVEIFEKYTPTVTLAAGPTAITYGETVVLTATVGKNGNASPLAGTVQFTADGATLGIPVAIDNDGKASLSVGKATLTVNGGAAHSFTARFIPQSSSDYKGETSAAATVTVERADMLGEASISGKLQYGETLTANTSGLSAQDGDSLGSFQYAWRRGDTALGSNATYQVQAEDIDRAITVVISPTNPNYKGKTSAPVTPKKADSTLTITGDPSKPYDGLAAAAPATTQTGSTGAVTFEWYSGAAKLDAAPKDAGSYTVKALLAANATHAAAEATKAFTIAPKAITPTIAPIAAVTYTGAAQTPALTVTDGTTTLTSGTDYTAAYSDNINAGVGTGKVTVTLKGNYSGTANAAFTIHKASGLTATAPYPILMVKQREVAYTFDLSTIMLDKTDAGAKTYALGALTDSNRIFKVVPSIRDNTMSFTSNSIAHAAANQATQVVTISSQNYEDTTVALSFDIIDKVPVTITGLTAAENLIYNGSAQSGVAGTAQFSPAWTGTLVYTYYEGAGTEGTKLSGAPTHTGTYTVVASIPDDDAGYAGRHAPVIFTIGAKEIAVAAGSYKVSKRYDGTADAGTGSGNLTVTGILAADSGVSVVPGTIPAYSDSSAKADYTIALPIAISGDTRSNYTLAADTVTVPGEITRASVTATVDTIAAQVYTGSQLTPSVTVKVDGSTIADTNYMAVYGANVNAGENAGTVTVKASETGNYIFADVTASFTIEKAAGADITADITGSYTGNGTHFTYTVTPIAGAEYKMDDGTWQDSNIFTDIVPQSKHIFSARMQTDANHNAGAEQAGSEVEFVRLPSEAVPTLGYTVSGTTGGKTITITAIAEAEYQFGSDTWSDDNAKTYASDETVIIGIRFKATATHEAGAAATTRVNLAKQQQEAPAAFTLSYTANGETDYTVTIPATPGCEYSFDGITYSSTNTKTANVGDTVTGYLRKAETETHNASSSVSASVTLPMFRVKPVTASPNGGSFTESVSVTLASDTSGADLYYTTDGSEPSASSTKYTAAFTLTETTTVKAIAVKDEMTDSDVASFVFSKSSSSSSSSAGGSSSSSAGGSSSSSAGGSSSSSADSGSSSSADSSSSSSAGGSSSSSADSSSSTINNGGNPGSNASSSTTGAGSGTAKNNKATVKITDPTVTKAIEKAKQKAGDRTIGVVVNVNTDKNAAALDVVLSKASIDALIDADVAEVTIQSGLSSVTFDRLALQALSGGEMKVTIRKVDPKTLSAKAQKAIGSRPVYRFGVTVGGKQVSDFKGGRAGLRIPYTRNENEQPGNLCAVYADNSGNLTWLEHSSYDPFTGMMLVSTTHFSVYGVGYKQDAPKFTDTDNHWAKNDIDFAASRGLLPGIDAATFAPDRSITRGMLVTAFGKLAGIDPEQSETSKFTDVAATAEYAPYAAWADANGIVTATGDTFGPDQIVTRQELAVALMHYSKALGYPLPRVHAEITFTDAGSISSEAKDAVKQVQMAGILPGKSGTRFDPAAAATRAEVAAMLRRYVELVVSTETAEGWEKNESGEWMYFEHGERVTGKKTIGGTTYTFDAHGVTTAPSPERAYLTHTAQKSEKLGSSDRKYKARILTLTKISDQNMLA